ncbi:PREDICTED: uncharacterized protein LOC108564179 [Nicrophorus vespilloides]|uniref:Uncharacterized protein LOC108564179 n=1 Tax=Nicrophorus vespilloides TaxID=110193 RepID=A0ABM1MVM4_NICVS|nr:PREDICTED: uncharacterized protein LOC108564179 [Nicrophorus vespilloides]
MSSDNKNNTALLVLSAISELRDTQGSTVKAITDFIENEYDVPEKEYKRYLRGTLQKGVAFGAIKKNRGKYQLGEVLNKLKKVSGIREMKGRRRRSRSGHRRRRRSRRRSGSRRRRRSRRRI